MSSFATGLSRARIRRQSGAVAMLGALWLMIAVICLATIDIGNVFWQKRELQKIADLAALAGATRGSDFCISDAKNNAGLNGLQGSDQFTARAVRWSTGAQVSLSGQPNACDVRVIRAVPFFFVWSADNSSREVEAYAIARMNPPLAMVHVRSTLASITSDRDKTLMNVLVGGLLGGSINVDLVGWKGLANLDVNLLNYLNALAPKVGLQVGNYEELLNKKIEIGVLVDVLLNVIKVDSPTASAAITALNALKVGANVSPLKVRLGDLLSLATGAKSSALDLSANVLELVQAMVQVGNGTNGLATDIEIPLIKTGLIYQGVKAKIRVAEKPQWKIGNPEVEEISAKTAQVRLDVNINLLTIDVGLGVTAGGAETKLVDYSCNPSAKSVSLSSKTSLLNLELTLSYKGILLIVPASTIGPVMVNLPGVVSTAPIKINNPKNVREALLPSDWRGVEGRYEILKSVGQLISDLIAGLSQSNGGLIANLVKFLGWVLTPVSEVLKWIIGELLSPLLDPLLNEVLKTLGIDLAKAEIAGQLTCGGTPELVY